MNKQFTHFHQNGAVLFVGLMMLLVMSLIAITSMQSTNLEERMAGNTRDSMVAFQASEAGLKAGETLVDSGTLTLAMFDNDGSDGLYDNTYDMIWDAINWTNGDSLLYTAFNKPINIETEPRFVVQHIAETQVAPKVQLENYGEGEASKTVQLFRITSRGTGGSDSTAVVLQSVYGSDW